MGSLNIIDDILAPSDRIKITFSGANPGAIMGMVPDMIKNIMAIPGKDLLETDVRWDVSSEPNDFYGVWMGKRAEDRWTKTFIRVIAQGKHHSKDKVGNFWVEIKGTVETNYMFANFIQRSFWWFYNHSFYYKHRRAVIEEGKDNIYDMRDFILDKFNIAQED